jgi:hypothetical protein
MRSPPSSQMDAGASSAALGPSLRGLGQGPWHDPHRPRVRWTLSSLRSRRLPAIAIADLQEREALSPRRPRTPLRSGLVGGSAALIGAFACYSLSRSPHYRGRLIRGSLRIHPGRGVAVQATYCETLLGRTVAIPGEVLLTGRSLHLLVHDPDSQLPIFFSFGLPGAPISVLCGVMSGAAFLGRRRPTLRLPGGHHPRVRGGPARIIEPLSRPGPSHDFGGPRGAGRAAIGPRPWRAYHRLPGHRIGSGHTSGSRAVRRIAGSRPTEPARRPTPEIPTPQAALTDYGNKTPAPLIIPSAANRKGAPRA